MYKRCTACKTVKTLEEFGVQANSKSKGNFVRLTKYKNRCKNCDAEYARDWRAKNPGYKSSGKLTDYPKEDRLLLSAISKRLYEAKQRSRKKVPLDIDKHYLYQLFKEQKGLCSLSGITLSLIPKTQFTLSLDKIDPALGYVKSNVQWVIWAANRAKGDMSQEMYIQICQSVTRKCNDYPEKEYASSEVEAHSP